MTQLFRDDRGKKAEKAAATRLELLLAADYDAWVAHDGDHVRAYALVSENGDHVFIRQFVVDEPERGRGVGRALFEALEEEYGAPQFRLDVMEGRDDARAFWERMGFAPRAVNMRREAPEES
jgi:GNAT superfamily N-acetyltransferase